MKPLQVLCIVFIVIAGFYSGLFAKTWYIKPDGTGDAPTIQAGVDSAAAGDTVLLAIGTYTGPGNRDIDFLGRAITVTSEDGRDVTIIDCQGLGRGFIFHNSEGASSILSGVTIKNGHGFDGGAVQCVDGSSPTLGNCTFSGNTAQRSGGGMDCRLASFPVVTDCIFSNNTAFAGGGILWQPGAALSTDSLWGGGMMWSHGAVLSTDNSATFTNCVFSGNSAYLAGGAMISGSSATFTNCTFSSNSGAGLFCTWSSHPMLTNCTFSDNSFGVHALHFSHPTLVNTLIAYSTSGEAVQCYANGGVTLQCCDVFGNAGGDWVGCIADQDSINGNFSADPLFCDPANGDFTLNINSPCLPGNHPYGEDCGLIGAWGQGCGEILISFDIHPRSCPNPFNIKWLEDIDIKEDKDHPKKNKGGVMPAAIVGSGNFDVTEVDISTLLLEGVAPIRNSFEDVTRPVTGGDECACTTGGPDGFMDLTLKFSRQKIAVAIGPAEDGDVVILTITGSLMDGTPFEASDCVTILSKHPEPVMFEESDEVQLAPPMPNPFNPVTRIAYWLPEKSFVKLSIYDVAGRLVDRLIEDIRPRGEHVVEWDASGIASGTYFLRLEVGKEVRVRRVTLLK